MRIRRVHVRGCDLPRRDPDWRTANYASASVPAVFVGIEVDGAIGVGATAGKVRHDTGAELVDALTTIARPILEGSDVAQARALLGRGTPLRPRAMLAIDLALHDLAGKLAGVPAEVLWGERRRHAVTAIRMVGQKPPGEMEQAVGPLVDLGYTHLKIKGGSGVQVDVQRIDAIRAGFGDRVQLLVDANGAYTPEEAILLCRRLGQRGVAFVEQPVAYDDVDGLAHVTRHAGTRVLADQCVHDVASATRVCRADAAHAVSVKLTKMGTVEECLRVAAVCHAHGIDVHVGGTAAPALVDGAACRLALSDDRFEGAAEVAESEGLRGDSGGGPLVRGGRATVDDSDGLGGPDELFRKPVASAPAGVDPAREGGTPR